MTIGYLDPGRVELIRREVTTWTLFQVTVDLHYVMFWFENGHALINVAHRFETRVLPGSPSCTYDVQADGDRKVLAVDHLLRRRVVSVHADDQRRLSLTFEGGGVLTIHDDPASRSAWFYRYDPRDHNAPLIWVVDDDEGESDLG